jgi:DNA-directed RNA polymerase
LIEFAEGKPLGERGVWWLGVHGANLWGNDKVSLESQAY